MLTTSEIAVTATSWALMIAGGFFATRAALRKKGLKCDETKSSCSKPARELKDQRNSGTGAT